MISVDNLGRLFKEAPHGSIAYTRYTFVTTQPYSTISFEELAQRFIFWKKYDLKLVKTGKAFGSKIPLKSWVF